MGTARTGAEYPKIIGLAALTAVLLIAAWASADVLLLLFGSALFAQILSGAADFVAGRTGLGRRAAFALVLIAVVAVVVLVVMMLAGRVAAQVQDLADSLPKAVAHLTDQLQQHEWGRQLLESLHSMQSRARGDVFGRVTGVFSSGLGVIANVVIILFGTLYFAADPGLYKGGLIRLIPPIHRDRVSDALSEAGTVLRWWMAGKLALMTFVGLATSIGLALLGVPMAATLGLLAGVADFVPNFGPLVAFIPAGLIALTIHPMLVLWVGLLYYGAQFTENYILTPIVQRHASNLAPAVIIFSQIALGVMFGGLGLLFAEPLAAAGQVVVKRLYVDALEER